MLSFKKIYEKAVHLFDDPVIQRAYVEDTVKWQKTMYPYLINGLAKFNNPTKIAYLLIDQTAPDGQVCILEANGSSTYVCDADFEPQEGCDFSFCVGKLYDNDATYDATTKTVTFSKEVPAGLKCSVEWYSCGQFNTDFAGAKSSTTKPNVIEYLVEDILANALVLAWAENEKNYLLDIRNLLTDTDFKMYSNANSLRSKIAWIEQLHYNFDTLTTKLSWNVLSRKYHGGNYYG